MPNISITRQCKRGCDYCFAMHERQSSGITHMPLHIYEDVLNFLKRSAINEARFLGGEPTEHPDFCEYVGLALHQEFTITIFTGGLVPETSLEYLCGIPKKRLAIILNTATPDSAPAQLVKTQERVCQMLASTIELGITLSVPNSDLDFLLNWIERYDLRKRVRLGIAHPILGGTNVSLRSQKLRILGSSLESFIDNAERASVKIDLDCGFTPCMFSQQFLEAHANLSKSIGLRCNSIIDIMPEGDVISCYALSRMRRFPLTETSTRDELIAMFDQQLDCFFPVGVYQDCTFCEYNENGSCNGGCRSRRALRLRPNALQLLSN